MATRIESQEVLDAEFLEEVRASFASTLLNAWNEAAQADGILAKIRRVTYDHGFSTALVDVEGVERRSEMQELKTGFEIPTEVIDSGDAVAFRREIERAVVSLRGSITRLLFKTAGDAADRAGNTIDVRGQALDGRAICDMLERMDIEFENGQPRIPSFVVEPSVAERLRELMDEPDVKLRMDAIVRSKWMARYTLKLT